MFIKKVCLRPNAAISGSNQRERERERERKIYIYKLYGRNYEISRLRI